MKVRWLSSKECVTALISHLEEYRGFFNEQKVLAKDQNTKKKATAISKVLNDHYLCGYFYFLQDFLTTLGRFNALFQAKRPLPHLLYEKLNGVRGVLEGYISFRGVRYQKADASKCRFGPTFKGFLAASAMGPELVTKLKEACWSITVAALEDLEARFPTEELYQACEVVDPRKIAIYKNDTAAAER